MLRNILVWLFILSTALGQAQDGFFLDTRTVGPSAVTERIETSVRAIRSDGGLIPPHYNYNVIEAHNNCLQNIRHSLLAILNDSQWNTKLNQMRRIANSPSSSPAGFEIQVQGTEITDHRGRTGLRLNKVNVLAHSHIDHTTAGRISAPISMNIVGNHCLWQGFEKTLGEQVDAAIQSQSLLSPKHHFGSPETTNGHRLQKALLGVPVIN